MATSSFYLKVISANRVFFAGKCRSLIVPEFDGQKEILAHHEDMVIAIDEGQMKFQPEGSDEWIGFDADLAKLFAESLGVSVDRQQPCNSSC